LKAPLLAYFFNKLNLNEQIVFKSHGWPEKAEILETDCSGIEENFEFVAKGWTKNVVKIWKSGVAKALKVVNNKGEDLNNCMKSDSVRNCHDRAVAKILKELILSRSLNASKVIQVRQIS